MQNKFSRDNEASSPEREIFIREEVERQYKLQLEKEKKMRAEKALLS